MSTKHIHRIPVAEEFIEPIGEAVCVFQYLDQALLDIGRCLDTEFYEKNENQTSGRLTGNLKKKIRQVEIDGAFRGELQSVCKLAFSLFEKRDAIVHSRGYATTDGAQGRLYRGEGQPSYERLNPDGIRAATQEAAELACRAIGLLHDPRMPNSG